LNDRATSHKVLIDAPFRCNIATLYYLNFVPAAQSKASVGG